MHAINSVRPLISVVIPFYNREDTLSYCIDSVLKADYDNLEVILIDDGSTDCSPAIGREYSARDNRVHYHRQQNSGVSSARNTEGNNPHCRPYGDRRDTNAFEYDR